MTISQDTSGSRQKHRPLGEQLNRSPRVVHASWMAGLAVLVAGAGAGFSVAGVLFLVVLFLPVYVAYRRDRLSLWIVFACLFLPTWPWAAYKAFARAPRVPATLV